MPYAEPTSPIPSPVKDFAARRGYITPPNHQEGAAGPSSWSFGSASGSGSLATGPMPGIPRRSSSSNGATTPRRGVSPSVSRQPSASSSTSHAPFPATSAATRPLEGLPRRASSSVSSAGSSSTAAAGPSTGVPLAGAAPVTNGESSLGLKLHPSPVKSIASRGVKDSMESTSTIESELPTTPGDEPIKLPAAMDPSSSKPTALSNGSRTPPIPYPTFEPLHRGNRPARSAMSSTGSRPTLMNQRRSLSNTHTRHNHNGSLQIDVTASTPSFNRQLPSVESPSPNPLRPASMVRKKSGEVVKSSLKQRSMSTPDLGRQPDSYPTTPDFEHQRDFPEERSKSVRFAGTDDGETGALENVVVFSREQKPAAVGKAADPERAGQTTDTETELDTDVDFVQFRTRRLAAARAIDEQDRIQLEGGSKVPRTRVDFSPDAKGTLVDEHVVLERVELQTAAQTGGPLMLRGQAIVRNVAYNKWVAVRFTLDHWQTVSEVSASHVCHIPSSTTGDEGWDRFGFSIKLEDYKRKLEERQLIMCIRFSVDGGREWWDSNEGNNYQFTFKKAPSTRRMLNAARAAASTSQPVGSGFPGGGYLRLNEPPVMGDGQQLPGLRQNRSVSPVSQISRSFGVPDSQRQTGPNGPRSWVFPKLSQGVDNPGAAGRSESPMPVAAAPPAAYRVPAPPDVHSHLSLSKSYCAPSPPTSPPRDFDIRMLGTPDALILNAPMNATSRASTPMNVFAGGYATLAPNLAPTSSAPEANADQQQQQPQAPAATAAPNHERRTSWSANTESWDSFSKALEAVENDSPPPAAEEAADAKVAADGEMTDGEGEATPTAKGSRSPMVDRSSSGESSPEHTPLAMKRSTGDLRALLNEDDAGLETPPSLQGLSSPPSPGLVGLPAGGDAMSPSPSLTSTGESSPIQTASAESTPDLASFPLQIDPEEDRGRPGFKTLSNSSYQEFLDRFCFFQSPRMTPNEEPVYTRPGFVPPPQLAGAGSGHSSPLHGVGFPFFASNASNSPRSTPTPTKQYDTAQEAFNFPVQAALPVLARAPTVPVQAATPANKARDSPRSESPARDSRSLTPKPANANPAQMAPTPAAPSLSPNENAWATQPPRAHTHVPSITAAN